MATVSIKQNDTSRKLSDTLTFNGVALNLTGASVQIVFKSAEPAVVPLATRRAATIVSAVAGTVEYQLVAGDTATAGTFLVEWEVTLSGGGILTIPDDGYHVLNIISELG